MPRPPGASRTHSPVPLACPSCAAPRPIGGFRCCPACGTWNVPTVPRGDPFAADGVPRMGRVTYVHAPTWRLGLPLTDALLSGSGGLPRGFVVLLAGEPGSGKSVWATQLLLWLWRLHWVRSLYATAEEGRNQAATRAALLGYDRSDNVGLLCVEDGAADLRTVLAHANRMDARVLVVDSAQEVYLGGESGTRVGLPETVKAVGRACVEWSKAGKGDRTVVLICHENKEGVPSGPKTLEHLVDAELHFEGKPETDERLLRMGKNRCGPPGRVHYTMTHELVVKAPGEPPVKELRGLVEHDPPTEGESGRKG